MIRGWGAAEERRKTKRWKPSFTINRFSLNCHPCLLFFCAYNIPASQILEILGLTCLCNRWKERRGKAEGWRGKREEKGRQWGEKGESCWGEKEGRRRERERWFHHDLFLSSNYSNSGGCPDAVLRSCIDACPGVSPKLFSACVKGCTKRCWIKHLKISKWVASTKIMSLNKLEIK